MSLCRAATATGTPTRLRRAHPGNLYCASRAGSGANRAQPMLRVDLAVFDPVD